MKKILMTLSAIIAMGLGASAQIVPDEIEIVTDENVQLEMITPAEPVKGKCGIFPMLGSLA